MDENFIEEAAKSIKEQRNEESKMTQLRSEILSEKIEYEKLVEEMKRVDLSEKDLEIISEFKESFGVALTRKIGEIKPLLEKEIGMYEKDLSATENNLIKSSNDEASLTFGVQVDYLNKKIGNLRQEIMDYQNILPRVDTNES
ncbi:MAG: hypothetical protein NT165_01195 [Candidatus Falkowbacteria bacterium]|nr:hypothetical protein [Candidatus Falkowbacteria bacterium]